MKNIFGNKKWPPIEFGIFVVISEDYQNDRNFGPKCPLFKNTTKMTDYQRIQESMDHDHSDSY